MMSDVTDRDEIIDLAVRYTWALDSRDLEDMRNVFTPNATGMLRGIECDGADAIIERIAGGAMDRFDRTQHLTGNHQVSIDGDTATHRCQLQAQHVRDNGDSLIIGGYYEDRLVRTTDGWRISHRLMEQTWISPHPD